MKIRRYKKESFIVIGKKGAATNGVGFIQRLQGETNSHFEEIQNSTQEDENGNISGVWGAMSDFSRSFQPRGDFDRGLYLAGVECNDDAEALSSWIKWVIPGYEYVYIERENDGILPEVTQCLADNDIALIGAVREFTYPQIGKGYMFFPIKRL